MCRPLLIVENGRSRLTQEMITELEEGKREWGSFVREGIIEYLDVNEENSAEIAISEVDLNGKRALSYTHMEIDPLTILGVCAGLIPYPHHNQSPRNTYQCAMGKQAMGTIAHNQGDRIDTILYLLVYPHRPLVKTRTLDLIGFNKLPAGHNATVAVMSYSGYDIEDALILNRASLDRGFGRCMVLKKFTSSLKKYSNGTTERALPPPAAARPNPADPQKRRNTTQYQKFRVLEDDGICAVGERLGHGDILVNKHTPKDTQTMYQDADSLGDDKYRPTPMTFKGRPAT